MSTINPSHPSLPFFGALDKISALIKKLPNKSLVITLVSAFLVVAFLGIFLNYIQIAINKRVSTQAPSIEVITEPVAFLPGQFVSGRINSGYIGQ